MRRVAVLGVLLVAIMIEVGVSFADAGPSSPRTPTIVVDRRALKPGERLIVTFNDWVAPAATLSVCGNLARRGSSDCDMVDSQGVGLSLSAPRMLAEFEVSLPPVPCPCVIKASSVSQNEVAFAPVDLIGAPVAPVVDAGRQSPITVTVDTHRAPTGFASALRSALGGRTDYDVTIAVRNRSAETISSVVLTGTAARGRTDIVQSFDIPAPGDLAPGQTRERRVRTSLPAPAVGRFVWSVAASGSGPPVHQEVATRQLPLGLLFMASILVGDLIAIAARRIRRRRRAGEPPSVEPSRLLPSPVV